MMSDDFIERVITPRSETDETMNRELYGMSAVKYSSETINNNDEEYIYEG